MTSHPLLEGSPYRAYVYSYPHKTAHRPLDPPRPLRDVWASERKDALFLYLHVPFCEMRCGFCNLFTTTGADDATLDAYLAQLERHAHAVRDAIGPVRFARLAIGGGTPTLLGPRRLARLFELARAMGADPREIPTSVETSPKTAMPDVLGVLRDAGVRRVSIGVQAFEERATRALGRPQRREEVERALERIRSVGFETLNVDLMYGAEGQSQDDWMRTVDDALEWSPEEIFLYPLYVRPITYLGKTVHAPVLDPRLERYRGARDRLRERGYEQLSMRLFRRARADVAAGPLYRCQEDGMVGIGCGARSYTERLHYAWPYAVGREPVRAILADYLARDASQLAHAHHGVELDEDDRCRRYVLMSILHAEGLDLARYRARFGREATADLPQLSELVALGLATDTGGVLRLTERGFERADAIGPWLYSPRVERTMGAFEWR